MGGNPTLVAAGIGCVGLFAGFLTLYFVSHFENYSAKQLGSVLTTVFAGAAISFVATQIKKIGADPAAVFWYPIGLVAGLILWVPIRKFGVASLTLFRTMRAG